MAAQSSPVLEQCSQVSGGLSTSVLNLGELNGLWLGSVLWSDGEEQAFRGCLVFMTEDQTPSVFGARFDPDAADDERAVAAADEQQHDYSDGERLPAILTGDWKAKALTVSLRDEDPLGRRPPQHYDGEIIRTRSADADGRLVMVLQGAVRQADRRGRFLFALEPPHSDAHALCGYAAGLAEPDASLADFLIPTNPIHWSLCLLRPPSTHLPAADDDDDDDNELLTARLFGCGLFDDSADVPGSRYLYFTIVGRWQPRTGRLHLAKIYQAYEQTRHYQIRYAGVYRPRTSDDDDDYPLGRLDGHWSNAASGAFGEWSARPQPPVNGELGRILAVCDDCGAVLKPGDVRWQRSHTSAAVLCPSCRVGKAPPLYAAVFSAMTVVNGSCTATMLLRAFRVFAQRPFFTLLQSTHFARRPDDPFSRCRTVPPLVRPPCRLPDDHPLPLQQRPDLQLRSYTFADVELWTLQLAAALRRRLGVDALARSHCLIAGASSPTTAVCQFAALVSSCVVVPLPAALDAASAAVVLAQMSPAVCIVDASAAGVLSALAALPRRPFVVLQDCAVEERLDNSDNDDDDDDKALPVIDNSATLSQLLDEGDALLAAQPDFYPVAVGELDKSAVSAVLFTSGTTSLGGSVKGAPFTEDHLYPSEGTCSVLPYVRFDFQPYDPTYLLSLVQSAQCGGERVVARAVDSALAVDCALLRPTHIGASPILWNNLYRDHLARRQRALLAGAALSDDTEERLVKQTRALLGNRLLGVTTGGAALSKNVVDFMRDALKLDVAELYGSRETGGIARNGVVYPAVTVCLLPVAEFGYDGTPTPCTADAAFLQPGVVYRGEVCVSTPRMIAGYHDAAANASFFTLQQRPFYRTGDVAEMWRDGSQRLLRIVDRVGALAKLATGTWISPAKIEAVLEEHPLVDTAFVAASPAHANPVAFVVPSPRVDDYWRLVEQGDTAAARAACTPRLLRELQQWCSHRGLKHCELPVAVHLDDVHWSDANQLMTPTEKKKRLALAQRFADTKDALFSSSPSASSTTTDSDGAPVAPELRDMLAEIFPPAALAKLGTATTFVELGGDSISASMLSSALRRRGVAVSPANVFRYTLGHLSSLCASAGDGGRLFAAAAEPTAAPIDWAEVCRLPAHTARTIADSAALPCRVAPGAGHVCLIGATGFLGPYLAAEILRQFPAPVQLHCLIRATSAEHARQRFETELQRAGLLDQLHSDGDLARVHYVNGSLSDAQLALSPDAYAALTAAVHGGHVFLNAAWVNMLVPYEGLAPTNVQGTLHVLALAARSRARLHFVSSVAALPAYDTSETWTSFGGAQLDGKDGYGQTKVVSERHLAQALAIDPALDVRLYRPGTISGDSRSGYANRSDFFMQLASVVASLGAAPISDARHKQLHWVPVDVVARGLVLCARSDHPDAVRGVFHFAGAGPLLSTCLQQLQRLVPRIVDVPAADWQQLAARAHAEGRIADSIYSLVRRISWQDDGGHSAGATNVRVDKTYAFLRTQFGFDPPVERSAEEIERICRWLVGQLNIE